MVEHQLPKLRVEGSIPFTRSNKIKPSEDFKISSEGFLVPFWRQSSPGCRGAGGAAREPD